MRSLMSPGGVGAQCAVHVGIAAPATCARCGNFMCLTCSENGSQRECPSCRALRPTDFPLNADARFRQLWDYSFAAFQREWLMLSISMLVFVGIAVVGGGLASVLSQVADKLLGIPYNPARPFDDPRAFLQNYLVQQVVTPFITIPVNAFALTGVYRVLLDVLRGRKADVNRLFVRFDLFPRFAAVHVLVWALTSLPMVIFFSLVGFVTLKVAGTSLDDSPQMFLRALLRPRPLAVMTSGWLVYVVVLLWLLPLFFFAPLEMLVSECQPLEALRRAAMLGVGERLRLLGYTLLSMAMMIAGVVGCFVGVLPAAAFASLLWCALFLVIRKGSVLPPPLT
ncbi:MAG: hypothetical protein U0228_38095 [Myxococcaceae bacterium]